MDGVLTKIESRKSIAISRGTHPRRDQSRQFGIDARRKPRAFVGLHVVGLPVPARQARANGETASVPLEKTSPIDPHVAAFADPGDENLANESCSGSYAL